MVDSKRLILAFFVFVVVFSVSNAEVIDQICSKYSDKDFCYKIVGNDPRASGVRDLKGMELLTVLIAQDYVRVARARIAAAQNTVQDEIGKRRLFLCQASLHVADRKFEAAWAVAKKDAYDDVDQMVMEGKSAIFICERTYKKEPVGVNPAADVTLNAQKVADIARIIAVMARGHQSSAASPNN